MKLGQIGAQWFGFEHAYGVFRVTIRRDCRRTICRICAEGGWIAQSRTRTRNLHLAASTIWSVYLVIRQCYTKRATALYSAQ
jgi:hypothetical protein